ncbi:MULTISPECIES: acyl-CoA dehydrogenase family protein [Micrococcaceae]|uniref:acyl-CoA dehydrogenase family protein n=1 Tax=unclassified Kocuria TaxID=2649579 RepID=UPI001EE0EFFE|nr:MULTISPECIES: acyl-CoA dehydrogenase family protein [unclassified Kocuria]
MNAVNPEISYDLTEPVDTDYLDVFSDATDEDRKAWNVARQYGREILPLVNGYWDRAEYPLDLVRRIGELDLMTDGLDVPGHRKLSPLAAGLVTMELSRWDGSMATAVAVQGGLALRSIALFGSEDQKKKYLDPLADASLLGSFALTEPDHGSDSVSLETRAVKDGDEYVITGEKKWIGNGASGGITVVWARDEENNVRGFIVDQESEGYDAEVIEGKGTLRAIYQARISLNDVRVPAENLLPGVKNFKDVSVVLVQTRVGVAWSALGHAISAYETALHYSQQRIQFGKPLAKFQMIQERLVEMLSEITDMQLMAARIAKLQEAGTLRDQQASLFKVHNTTKARKVLATARDMLGGNGVLLENHVIRHMFDIEGVHTYEGTENIQRLIVGRDITGQSAFA